MKITMHASVLDVTPETEEDAAADTAPAAEQTAAAEPAAPAEPAAEAAPAAAAPDPELVAAGEKVFKKCKACHQIGEGAKNKVGPELNGVLGRTAGGLPEGFKYSNPMNAAGEGGLVWTDATLAEFLTNPRNYIKGTKMTFAGLKKDDDIKAITAYLASFGN